MVPCSRIGQANLSLGSYMDADAQRIQRQYYAQTATEYEELHMQPDDEHYFALAWMLACIDQLGCTSVLDVGSGTGRAVAYLRKHRPALHIVGVEPSADLRSIGHQQGIPVETLVEGDATKLSFDDGSFDIVCEFGVLHHLATPTAAVTEMLRVSRKAVFISDDNHFAGGSKLAQRFKRTLAALGLWRAAYLLRTGGKGYRITEEDGLAYPYSVFDDLELLRRRCLRVHCLNTRGCGPDLWAGASHVAVLGVKNDVS